MKEPTGIEEKAGDYNDQVSGAQELLESLSHSLVSKKVD